MAGLAVAAAETQHCPSQRPSSGPAAEGRSAAIAVLSWVSCTLLVGCLCCVRQIEAAGRELVCLLPGCGSCLDAASSRKHGAAARRTSIRGAQPVGLMTPPFASRLVYWQGVRPKGMRAAASGLTIACLC